MFFVGVTGQLITLILSVCFPLVLLLGNHKTDIHRTTLSVNIHQNHNEISSFDFNSFEFEQNNFTQIDSKIIKIEDSDFIRIPHSQINVKQKLCYLDYSGNKAPPASTSSYC